MEDPRVVASKFRLTNEQSTLLTVLHGRSERIAQMYLGAIIAVNDMSSPVKIDAVRDYEADRLAEMNRSRADITLDALQALARFLSGIPARKNVIWFADSFPVSFLADVKVHTAKRQELLQQTSDLLTAGQIAIYPVSASGIVGDTTFEATDLRNRGDRQPVEAEAVQIAMETIAQDTGGRAFYNRNGLSDAFAAAVNQGAQYYTLAYSPTDIRYDGRYRHIEVTVPNSDYNLHIVAGILRISPLHAPRTNPRRKTLSFRSLASACLTSTKLSAKWGFHQ